MKRFFDRQVRVREDDGETEGYRARRQLGDSGEAPVPPRGGSSAIRKGGHNDEPSQVTVRPAAPAPMRAAKSTDDACRN